MCVCVCVPRESRESAAAPTIGDGRLAYMCVSFACVCVCAPRESGESAALQRLRKEIVEWYVCVCVACVCVCVNAWREWRERCSASNRRQWSGMCGCVLCVNVCVCPERVERVLQHCSISSRR